MPPCAVAAESPARERPLNLFIVHYHFRPGGVRRVIELAAPAILREIGAQALTLLAGERPPAAWLRGFRAAVQPARVRVCVDARLGYTDAPLDADEVGAALARALRGPGVVWAHNLALGRNLPLSRALAAFCAGRDLRLVSHHHDWWCDRRWGRWPLLRRTGFPDLRAIASAIFPGRGRIAHVAINRADAAILQRHFGGAAHWLPNLIDRPATTRRLPASEPPLWLMPCRILRRKNIAEALLLTRWLRPEATLVVTGGADEKDEQCYAAQLATAARTHRWRLRLGVLAGRGKRAAPADMLARAEVIVFASLQEGFGLPQLEAAAAGRPALLRRLPLVASDLASFGFRFPQLYDDVQIAPELFDWPAEVARQSRAWRAWRDLLPRSVRPLAEAPAILAGPPRPVAFSRLTLPAQLEVLRQPVADSWSRCAPLNASLLRWRGLAAHGALQPTRWPRTADAHLGGAAYARRFAAIAHSCAEASAPASAGLAAQQEFIRARLDPAESFPLLWSPHGGAITGG